MKKLILLLCLFPVLNVSGTELGGLILYGVDTISTKTQFGFDFVTQKSCTAGVNSAPFLCVNHFTYIFDPSTSKYILAPDNEDGPAYCINAGKMNLDSIKTAPDDSIFTKQPNGHGDDIPVDSLSSRIGNVYLMKTATDPRTIYNRPFYAKIRILKFIVLDSALHQIKMVFLWVYNDSGLPDLTSASLDTFHLDGITPNQPNNRLANCVNRASPGQYVFKVLGDRFTLPQELVGRVKWLTVWDLRGKKVGRIEVGNERILNLQGISRGNGIVVGRIE